MIPNGKPAGGNRHTLHAYLEGEATIEVEIIDPAFTIEKILQHHKDGTLFIGPEKPDLYFEDRIVARVVNEEIETWWYHHADLKVESDESEQADPEQPE